MINSVMKIKDVLKESATDVVARFYLEAGKEYDKFYNPEDVKYKEKNNKYYEEHFKQWFSENVVPVFTKPTTPSQPEYTNKPKEGKLQSPGYRGLEYAKAKAGLPYDHKVQRYNVSPQRMFAAQTMDGARNNNGQ
jgi:hypothetical protein